MDAASRRQRRYAPLDMRAAEQLVTAEEYLRRDEERFVELIDGRIVMNEPTVWHQTLQIRIASAIHAWTEAAPRRGLALPSVNVRLDQFNVFGPDVSWISEDRRPAQDAAFVGAPDLVVEIRSPSTWRHDIGRKCAHYERFGVGELWLVDGFTDSVVVCRREAPAASTFDLFDELRAPATLTSPQLPDFALALASLFARFRHG